ncbi:hypothetical protein LTR95_003000 [Oleoguttula sp. CCFEE 5521]|uniref:H-type lectin domain-containing protein n=1 Tax=Cryoendolithus antarcticus TaxID=1507870 RepID=A0A1V8S9Q2_9PEZI|nr:hypothetical protein B0A48_18184 [Cryoendolithus antarcticus]
MSSWMPSFGGGGKGQEEEAKQWREGTLGTGDEFFTHSRDPGEDNGHFKVSDVRPKPKTADRGASRLVRLPKGHYEKPPVIAKGLKMLDLNGASKDHFEKAALDLHVEVFVDNERIVSPLVQAWLSDEKTQLIYDAELVWMEAKEDAHDSAFLTTTFDLTKGETEKSMKYPKSFPKDTEVEVSGWLQGFRFKTDDKADYQCDFYSSKVTNKGFTAHVDCGESCERLDVTWIVNKKGKKKVATGSFSTEDVEDKKDGSVSGKVEFEKGTFTSAPTVLVALSQFDLKGGQDLKIGVEVSDVSKTGFKWTIKAGGKDALRSAEATYFTLGYA